MTLGELEVSYRDSFAWLCFTACALGGYGCGSATTCAPSNEIRQRAFVFSTVLDRFLDRDTSCQLALAVLVDRRAELYADPSAGILIDEVIVDGALIRPTLSILHITEPRWERVGNDADLHLYFLELLPDVDSQGIVLASVCDDTVFDPVRVRVFTIPKDVKRLTVRYRARYPTHEFGPLMEARVRAG